MNVFPHEPASAMVLPLRRRVLSFPRTSPGKWSLGLVAAFVFLLCAFFAILAGYGGAEKVRRFQSGDDKFLSNPHLWLALTLFPAAISALAAGTAALMAIIKRAERSIFMLLPLLVAGLALLVSVGELMER